MAKIGRFEEIEGWKLSRELVRMVYNLTQGTPFAQDYGLKDQIQRAAVSTMSNIAEGFERNSTKEFIQSLYVARGSVAEVRSLLYVASDLGYIAPEDFAEVFNQAEETSKTIFGFIKYLSAKDFKTF
ncbi:MAG: four helix bundle protein [Candidatus Bipolaricaulia bacterium]